MIPLLVKFSARRMNLVHPFVQTFKSASAGSLSLTIFRIFLMAAAMLCCRNRVVPATNVSAPARAHSAAVWLLMPPSTLMRYGSFRSRRHASACWIFGRRFVDEFLPAKAGIDGHHQQQINLVQKRLDQR